MVFILYKLYVLLPYTYPTPKLSPHKSAFVFSTQKTHSVWFISFLNYGNTENVAMNHLLLVIPMSYTCHYTNLCPHKPHKCAHTRTQTHTHTHTHAHTHARTQAHTHNYGCFSSTFSILWVFNYINSLEKFTLIFSGLDYFAVLRDE